VTLVRADTWQVFRAIARDAREDAAARRAKGRKMDGSGVAAVGRPKKARYGMPPDVHVVRAKGREYFYFQKNRCERDEGPRVKIAGRPYGDDGTPEPEWWAKYRALAGTEAEEENKAAGSFRGADRGIQAESGMGCAFGGHRRGVDAASRIRPGEVGHPAGDVRGTAACVGATGQFRRCAAR
jgi:hypothetical protein